MARSSDTQGSLRNAIKKAPNGKMSVATQKFVSELEKRNGHGSPKEINAWMKSYTACFRNISAAEGEEMIWLMFNPNGGYDSQ